MKPIGWKFGDKFKYHLISDITYKLCSSKDKNKVDIEWSINNEDMHYIIEISEANENFRKGKYSILLENSEEMQINLQNLAQGKSYLVNKATNLEEIKILAISEKAYKIETLTRGSGFYFVNA